MLSRLGDLLRTTFGQALVGAVLVWAALPLPCWLSHLLGPVSPNCDTWQNVESRAPIPGPWYVSTAWLAGTGPGPWVGPAPWVMDTWPYMEAQAPLPGPWYASTAWLAWIGPAWWVMLARRRELPGRRPYRALWLVGFLFWLAELYWLTLPYWATSLGWLAVSVYLGFYLPVFVGLVRVAVHRLRIPVIVAAPVVWTGLELARGHLLTGVTMASLGHTQYRWLELIQLSDVAGAYGVSFVVMLVAACLARMVPLEGPLFRRQRAGANGPLSLWERVRVRGVRDRVEARPHPDPLPEGEGGRWCFWPLAPAAAVVTAALVYGHARIDGQTAGQAPQGPAARIALVQGSFDIEVKSDPDKQQAIMEEYAELSREAVDRYSPLDLLVWPETMFRIPLYTYDPEAGVPENWPGAPDEFDEWIDETTRRGPAAMALMAERLDTPLLLGVDAFDIQAVGAEAHNSAAMVDRSGNLVARYDKMHPVMFGEYIPLAGYFPWLARLSPIGAGLTPGRRPVAVQAGPVWVAPNICYESVLPQVIRRPVNALAAEGREPDVLVNLTNDGWYYGANELDLHLICGVFRAVECRKPFLIAANTGFSAWIDGDGRIVALGPRRATGTVVAEVRPDPRQSWYLRHGDWAGGVCLAVCVVLAAVGCWPLARARLTKR